MPWEALGRIALLVGLSVSVIRLINQMVKTGAAVVHFFVRLEEKIDVLTVSVNDLMSAVSVLIEKR